MSKSVVSRMAGQITERVSPLMVVMIVASLVLAGSVLFRYFTQEQLDPRVRFSQQQGGEVSGVQSARRSVAATLGDDDPAVRYADRLRDASALALAYSLYTLKERLVSRRLLPNVAVVLDGLNKAGLLPPGMTVANPAGVVRSPVGLYYIRYRPQPFGVEVLAVGANGLSDGEVFLVRVPETTKALTPDANPNAAQAFATTFVSPRSDTLVPKPFAPASVYLGAGWTQEPLRSTPYSRQQTEELKGWLAQYQGKASQ